MHSCDEKNAAVAPVAFTHTDYSLFSGPKRIKELTESGAYFTTNTTSPTTNNYQIINVWRSCTEYPVYRQPLAIVDATTVPAADVKTFQLRYPHRTGENECMTADTAKNHKWFYYPMVQKDEALIFVTYDTVKHVFHCAFPHPATPVDSPTRISIEIRAVAFYDEK
jgi:hypothetical protein